MSGLLPKGSPPQLKQAFEELSNGAQRSSHTLFSRAPFAGEIPQNGVVFALISSTMYLYTRNNSDIYRVAMTKV
jgi:hypothetical protein